MRQYLVPVWSIVLILASLVNPALAADRSVVVIPLGDSAASQARQVFLPATLFRPVLAATAWQFEENGAAINPNAPSYWVAPIALPEGSQISSLELVWKNASLSSNVSASISLLVSNEGTGASGVVYTVNSGLQYIGVRHTVSNFDFTVTDTLHPQAYVYLASSSSWLLGVTVSYTAP